jgi:ATP-dependent DNA helicase RecQ
VPVAGFFVLFKRCGHCRYLYMLTASNMVTPLQLLNRYWGYPAFRPLQEAIIHSILQGNDTLALMPTGGGKSLCFQIPALIKDGVCIVISPLIALMKDQVENLRKKGIKAVAVISGMSRSEMDIAFDNCTFGNYKFLYISPERLAGAYTQKRIEQMNVNLIAVDEAHCISQWGYDFRPAYLEIAEIRKLHPDVPILALTATATSEVVADIQQKLSFKKENVFRHSFARKNLAYIVLHQEDKIAKMVDVLHKVKGSAIVYVRSRKAAREYSDLLIRHQISSTFYHAGLTPAERHQRQHDWLQGKFRVMVATNAFGMGIDKPDVRLVIHLDMPDSLEAYFQEAGRAGRDEKQAYAVLFFSPSDVQVARKRFAASFPPIQTVKDVYHALGNYLQVALHSGKGMSYDFDLYDFVAQFPFNLSVAYHSLKWLEADGYIMLSEAVHLPSRIMFTVNQEQLYRFQVQHPTLDYFIKVILRTYPGLFDEFVKISENELAIRAETDVNTAVRNLEFLHRAGILEYQKQTDKPQLTFLTERYDRNELRLSIPAIEARKERFLRRQQAIIRYASTSHRCRHQMLLLYFGEESSVRCGQCDFCRSRNKLSLSDQDFERIAARIKILLQQQPVSAYRLVKELNIPNEDQALAVIQWMVDNQWIAYDSQNKGELRWIEKE